MPNPTEALYNSKCDVCGDFINKGDNIYFHEDNKFCEGCADANDIVCNCGNYKKSQYKTCWYCKK